MSTPARPVSAGAIVLDIEGTTTPTEAVHGGLYGYTRAHLRDFLAAGGPAEEVLAQTRELAQRPDADADAVAQILCGWLDSDVKAAPLKAAQGLICAQGFATGALHGEFFADVPPALAAWHAAGVALYVYSSGSVRNQQDWFHHARGGSLTPLISGWFDLNSAGPKREAPSYHRIAEAIGLPAGRILFLTDHPDELDAAAAAGWSVLGVARPGEPNPPRPPHDWISSFDELAVARG